jgi:Flp pilus assembly protein TadG
MMALCKVVRRVRRGAVIVETAFVMVWMTMFLFGIYEYSRLVMDLNLLNNTSTTISTDVQGIVTTFMAGENVNFTNLTITTSGTHAGVNTTVNNLAAGDMITVSVTGNYKYMGIIPMITTPPTVPLATSVSMVCEGGT